MESNCVNSCLPGIKGKILVMDDNQSLNRVMKRILTSVGYEVEFAGTGEQAIDLYKKAGKALKPFDAVIMDLSIPGGLGGEQAVGMLLEIDPAAKVIAASGNSNNPVMSEFAKYGFRAAVTKPFAINEISELLQSLIK
jgi:CheY-like chemotaxis protein